MINFVFSDLFLLIGTNPLPNFVTLKYFSLHNEKLQHIWLIYSEENKHQSGTKHLAENIESILNNKSLHFHYIKLSNVENLKKIIEELSNDIFALDNNIIERKIHLNYTGGTKIMGIAAHKFVEENFSKYEFSYVSARTFMLVNDEGICLSDKDLRSEIKIPFMDLIKLHSFERKNEDKDLLFNDVLHKFFAERIKQNTLQDYFKNYNRDDFIKGNDLINKFDDFKNKWNNLTPSEDLVTINSLLPDDFKLFEDNKKPVKSMINKNCGKVIKYIDGDWFEQYVFEVLQEIKDELGIEIWLDWEIKKNNWEKTNFQIDVIFIKGYQLFGVSCTTDNKLFHCKQKGFEILLRTKQIGGDEAKAILITRLNDADKIILNDILIHDTGSSSKNILVLGMSDLKKDNLKEKFTNFINQEV